MLTKRTTSVNTVPWVFATKVPWCATCFSTQESVRIGVKVANPRSRLVTGSRDTFSNTILITQLLKSSTHLANSNRPNTIIRLNKPTVRSNAGNGNSLLHRHHPLLNLPCRRRPLIWRELVHNGENLVKTSELNLTWARVWHTGYIEVFMQGKCGRNTETTFDIKWVPMAIGKIKILRAILELPAK